MTRRKPASAEDVHASLIGKDKAFAVLSEESLGAAEPLSLEEQFIEAVLKWLRCWFDETEPADLKPMKPCVFVFAGDEEPVDVLPDLTSAPSFKSSTDASLSGRVHVSALQMRKVFRKQVGFVDVPGAVSWAQENGLQKYTSVVVSLKAREALILRKGVDADDCNKVAFAPKNSATFDFSHVPGLLDEFHKRYTKTHLGFCRVWAKATARVLKQSPEHQIQGSLLSFFEFTARPSVLVDEEFATYKGRGDVRLARWRRSKGDPEVGVIEVCIMELKVLFPKNSADKNEQWALSGIQQLLDYREAKPAPGPSYLCCFDGRPVDADIPAVEKRAKEVGVGSKRFFLQTPGCKGVS